MWDNAKVLRAFLHIIHIENASRQMRLTGETKWSVSTYHELPSELIIVSYLIVIILELSHASSVFVSRAVYGRGNGYISLHWESTHYPKGHVKTYLSHVIKVLKWADSLTYFLLNVCKNV